MQRAINPKTLMNFNPRSREGSDHTGTGQAAHTRNFNPRSREGSDRNAVNGVLNGIKFQSTLP